MRSSLEYPRRAAALVIVDSPGKIAVLDPALRRAGMRDFHIFPVVFPVQRFPDAVPPIGLNVGFEVCCRNPADANAVRLLQSWAMKADRVFVTTDVDERGDIVAADVARLLRSHPQVNRVRLRGLSFDSIVAAFSRPERIAAEHGWPALLREVVDRSVRYVVCRRGGALSDVGQWGVGDLVLAATLSGAPPWPCSVDLSLPATDAAGPFYARVEFDATDVKTMQGLTNLAECAHVDGVRVAPSDAIEIDKVVPWSFSDCLFEIASAGEWSISEVRQSMWRLYEKGELSYPFGDARALGSKALTVLARVADDNGVRFDPDRIPSFSRAGPHDHEAPHPIGSGTDISTPIGLMSRDGAVLALITRRLLACGQPHVRQTADPSTLPTWAKEYSFERVASLWLSPVQRRAYPWKIRLATAELVLIDILRTRSILRPGSEVEVIERLLAAGLVDERGTLSDRGRALLASVPVALLDATLAVAGESAIRSCFARDSFAAAARNVLSSLGLGPETFAILDR